MSSDLRTPLSHAKGLGSAHDGTSKWWSQRLTAFALIPLGLWFIVSLVLLPNTYVGIIHWMQSTPNTAGLILVVWISFYHSFLGLEGVYEDYIPREGPKLAAIFLTKAAFIIMGLFSILAILKIYFQGP